MGQSKQPGMSFYALYRCSSADVLRTEVHWGGSVLGVRFHEGVSVGAQDALVGLRLPHGTSVLGQRRPRALQD